MVQDSTQSRKVPASMSGMRFDHALAQLLPEKTRSQLQKLVRKGSVKLNGKKVLRSNIKLNGGELITFCLDGGLPSERAPLQLTFLFEDEQLAVVNKPPGMLTHPTEQPSGGSMAELLVERFGPLPSREDAYRPGIVHRLDRETSGVMVVARTELALDKLQAQFRAREVSKRYLALVHGNPTERSFRVDAALESVPGQRDLQGIFPGGKAASTEFEVIRQWQAFALVRCFPKTGRRHQLRVHLWSMGHPIAGDKLYRLANKELRVRQLRHHALHSECLEFSHPLGGELLRFEAAPFPELTSFIEGLGS